MPWIQFVLLLAVLIAAVVILFCMLGELDAIKWELFKNREGSAAFGDPGRRATVGGLKS